MILRSANGHINFEKFWQLAKQVTEVVAWQQITCPFPKVQTVLTSLQTAPVFGESGKLGKFRFLIKWFAA